MGPESRFWGSADKAKTAPDKVQRTQQLTGQNSGQSERIYIFTLIKRISRQSRSLPAVIVKARSRNAVGPFFFLRLPRRQHARRQRIVEARAHELHRVRKTLRDARINLIEQRG